jgi:hypothetical protein
MVFEANEEDLLEGLVGAICAVPRSRARIIRREIPLDQRRRIDAIVEAEIAGRPLELIVEAKRQAFPRDVRETIYQLRNYLAHYPSESPDVIPFFVAGAISPGARDLLRHEEIGFYDLGGTLYIPGKHTFIHIDRPAPRKTSKIFDSIFQGQKARVMLYVFEHRRDWLSVKTIAEEAEVSAATASATLTEMERREWVEAEGAGPAKSRRLKYPERMLDAWTQYILGLKPPKLERFYVRSTDVNDLMHKLHWACDESDAAYAVTGEAAAQVYAPYLSSISQVRCRIVPGPRRHEALDRLRVRPASEGWNLALMESNSRGDVTVGDKIDDVMFAPPLQVYLDLLQGSGRSKEMASHLRAERLEH